MFSDTQKQALERFVDLFFKENEIANLSGCRDRKTFWRKHVVDAAMLDQLVRLHPGQKVVDIGTGGGLPGLVLAILHPKVSFVLVDSHRKKTDACERMRAELGLANVTVVRGRAEKLGRDPAYRETFDWAVSRAVSALPVLLEYALPLVIPGGWFVSYKGPDPADEVAASRWPIKALGGRLDATRSFTLPEGDDQRSLVFVEKIGRTTKAFPRKCGAARKSPISEKEAQKAIDDRMRDLYAEKKGNGGPRRDGGPKGNSRGGGRGGSARPPRGRPPGGGGQDRRDRGGFRRGSSGSAPVR
jgi:16S rRNA (guanine527-N7)-methyltransferase